MRVSRRLLGVVLFACLSAGAAEPEAGYGQGQVHPDFELPKLDGEMGKLSDYRGKRVLLFNFASW